MKIKRFISVLLCAVCIIGVCGCGEPESAVTYEISADKSYVTFFAEASASEFTYWSFSVESDGVVTVENVSVDNSPFTVRNQKKLTALAEGKTYISFSVSQKDDEYSKNFGFFVTVDSLLQISVEVAESDSMLGKEV